MYQNGLAGRWADQVISPDRPARLGGFRPSGAAIPRWRWRGRDDIALRAIRVMVLAFVWLVEGPVAVLATVFLVAPVALVMLPIVWITSRCQGRKS